MAITPAPGFQIDPNNPNGVIPIASTAMPGSSAYDQQVGTQPSTAYGAVNTNVASTIPTTAPNNAVISPTSPTSTAIAPAPLNTGDPNDPSIVNALNAGGQASDFASRTKLAQQYGIEGYTGTADQNTQLLQKYRSGLSTLQQSGQQAPTTQGAGSAAVSGVTGGQTQMPSINPVDTIMMQDKAHAQYLADYKALTDFNAQRTSLVDEYKKMQAEANLPNLNAEAINMKNVIEGTEDDIRNEITASGGFGTESQVQALASARNKGLIKNYNKLVDTIQNATQNINTMIGLSQQDKEYALQSLKDQLNFDQQQIEYADKFTNNAKEAYNNIIKNVGYSGLFQSLQSNPNNVSIVERTLGLGAGGLGQLAQQQTLDQQAESRLQARAIDTSTGTSGSVKGGSMSGTATAGTRNLSPISESVISNPSLFYNFTPTQKAQIVSELQSNGYDISKLQNAKLSTAQQDEIAQMNTVSGLINDVLKYNSDGQLEGIGSYGLGTLKTGLAQLGIGGKEGQDVRALIGNIKGTVAKLRGGTSFTPNEEKLLNSYTPSINDSSGVAINKLHLLQDFIAKKNADLIKAIQINATTGQVTKPNSSTLNDIKSKYNLTY